MGDVSAASGPALVVAGPDEVSLEERAIRAPGAGEVLITPRFVGVCGTDLEIVEGRMDPDYVRYPIVLGHEWSGVVAAIGVGVTRVAVGDTVVVEGIVPDGVCPACRAGDTNLCEVYAELGFTLDGAAGPGVVAAQHLVHRLSDSVTPEAGALVEPMSVVMRGLLEADPPRGARVLVVGDGTVGLLAAHLVRLWSPSHVTVAGRREAQRELALALGADEFTTGAVPERSVDFVIEAAGASAAVATALTAARRGGGVLLLGISGHGSTLPVSSDDIVNNDLSIRGSFGYTAAAWALVVSLLGSGAIRPEAVITHRFALDDWADALRTLGSSADDAPRGKVMLLPGGDS